MILHKEILNLANILKVMSIITAVAIINIKFVIMKNQLAMTKNSTIKVVHTIITTINKFIIFLEAINIVIIIAFVVRQVVDLQKVKLLLQVQFSLDHYICLWPCYPCSYQHRKSKSKGHRLQFV